LPVWGAGAGAGATGATGTAGATRPTGSASTVWRGRNATTVRAQQAFRAVVIGGAGQDIRRTVTAGTEGHAGFSGVAADLVLVAVVDHHLEAIVVTDLQSNVPAHLGPERLGFRDRA